VSTSPRDARRNGASLTTRLAVFICTFGYIGYFPFAPGTVGSAAGLVVYWLVHSSTSVVPELAVILVICIAGVWSGTVAERVFGTTDPGAGVIDEVAGMLVTLVGLPFDAWTIGIGFFLFRLFDVIKPFPAGRFERLPGGLGMVADDVMAGVYANLALRALFWFMPAA
jgi:phosphatidylglycerophosphatase A